MRKMPGYLSLILICATVLSWTSGAQAQQYGAISTATVDTGRASVEPTEAPILNPATIPFARGYFFTSDYAAMDSASEFTVGLTDNMADTIVPTAFIYTQFTDNYSAANPVTTQDFRLEFANLVTKTFSFGLAARYRTDSVLATQYRQTNVLLGSLYTFTPDLGVALILDNLISPDTLVPMAYRLLPGISAGVNYNYKKVIRFKFDATTASNDSLNSPSLGVGLEAHWNRWTVFRMGARKILEYNTDEYGVGFGFSGPKFAIHYGYMNCPQQEILSRQAVDLAVPIW